MPRGLPSTILADELLVQVLAGWLGLGTRVRIALAHKATTLDERPHLPSQMKLE
jgi:hypothetical protein